MVLEQDFPHDAHAGQGRVVLADGEKSRTMLRMCDLNRELSPRAALNFTRFISGPADRRIPGVALMGAGGQRDALEHVPVEAAQDEPVQQARGDGESG